MSSLINTPPTSRELNVVEHPNGEKVAAWSKDWASWFTQAFQILFAEQQSGTTAQRPTRGLYPGRPYFDISLGALGKKIFVDKDLTGWVDSSGNVV